jgi:hypothetical protein
LTIINIAEIVITSCLKIINIAEILLT